MMSAQMNIYKVGIMSDVRYVQAPSAKAAALYYSLGTFGNAKLIAAVYEVNGEPCDETVPWGEYAFGDQSDDELFARFEDDLMTIKPEIAQCSYVDPPENDYL